MYVHVCECVNIYKVNPNLYMYINIHTFVYMFSLYTCPQFARLKATASAAAFSRSYMYLFLRPYIDVYIYVYI